MPRLGDIWAMRRDAPMMSREERSRRYLSEMGPLGMIIPRATGFGAAPQEARARHHRRPHQRH